jgi:hypothetical protein
MAKPVTKTKKGVTKAEGHALNHEKCVPTAKTLAASRTHYVVGLFRKGSQPHWLGEKDLVAAERVFFFYCLFMKSGQHVLAEKNEWSPIVHCELHKIYESPTIKFEKLSEDTLLRSSRELFSEFEIKQASILFRVFH